MSIKKTWFSVVKPALAATITVFLAAGAVNADADVQKAQRLLNALGFDAGSVDGQWGKKSQTALSEFLISQNQTFDGTLDQTELDVLQAAATAKNISTKPLSGVEIENANLNFVYAPVSPGKISEKYSWTEAWSQADFNKDGLDDILYIGVMRPDNINVVGTDVGSSCGYKKCTGVMPGPTLYLQDLDGNFYEKSGLLRDDRDTSGQSLAKQSLVGDLNGDGIFDLFLADTGMGGYKGVRDSYFLSQADGSWIESSDSHLSDQNLIIFDHGAAIGDIDGDGDLDIVLTELKDSLTCWINSGDGHLKKKNCGTANAFAIELADMDGDSDLDLVHNGLSPTGISWNDGIGNFLGNLKLPDVTKWETTPEVSIWDLDGDGDNDIVFSRTENLYVGAGIQVLENLGKNEFNSEFYPLVVAPKDFVPEGEGNEWNTYVQAIRFSDVDNDDLTDIVFVGGGDAPHAEKVKRAFLKNLGGMKFKHIYGDGADNPIKALSADNFIEDKLNAAKQTIIVSKSEKKTDANKAFTKFSKAMEFATFSETDFSLFDDGILMPKSGAVLLGVGEENLQDQGGRFDLLVQWAGKQFPVAVCFEYYTEQKFAGFRVNFSQAQGFGGLDDLRKFGSNGCRFETGRAVAVWEVSEDAKDIGLWAFLDDLQANGLAILENFPGMTDDERNELASRFR